MAGSAVTAAKKIAEKRGFKVITGSEAKPFRYIGAGLPQLDTLGGAVVGRYDVVFGPEGCGKTTLIARRAAQAQKMFPERSVLLADAELRFAPKWWQTQGVDTDKLLVLQNMGFMEDYYDAMLALVNEGVISYAPIDSISAMTPRDVLETSKGVERSAAENQVAADAKKIQQFIKMSKESFFEHEVACTIIAQVRTHGIGGAMTWQDFSGGHMLRHMASQIWKGDRMGKSEWEYEDVNIDGQKVKVVKSFGTRWTLSKDTGPNESKRAFVKFVVGTGFDDFESHIRAAIRLGVIENPSSGTFILPMASGEKQKIRGIEKVFEFYKTVEELTNLKALNLSAHTTEAGPAVLAQEEDKETAEDE